MVLDLIIDDEGGNRLVESKRGKLYRAPPEEAEVIEEVLEAEETTGDAADEAELDIDDEEGAPAPRGGWRPLLMESAVLGLGPLGALAGALARRAPLTTK